MVSPSPASCPNCPSPTVHRCYTSVPPATFIFTTTSPFCTASPPPAATTPPSFSTTSTVLLHPAAEPTNSSHHGRRPATPAIPSPPPQLQLHLHQQNTRLISTNTTPASSPFRRISTHNSHPRTSPFFTHPRKQQAHSTPELAGIITTGSERLRSRKRERETRKGEGGAISSPPPQLQLHLHQQNTRLISTNTTPASSPFRRISTHNSHPRTSPFFTHPLKQQAHNNGI